MTSAVRLRNDRARVSVVFGLLGLCLGLTAALSLAFFGLLLWSE